MCPFLTMWLNNNPILSVCVCVCVCVRGGGGEEGELGRNKVLQDRAMDCKRSS